MAKYLLNVFIVRNGYGSKIVNSSKKYGITGGTVLIGTGTFKNKFLDFFELNENSKEIVFLLSTTKVLHDISNDVKLTKKKIGVSFSLDVEAIIGSINFKENEEIGGNSMSEQKSIFVIVDKGNGSKVVDIAIEAGARGATIINARGSGIHETSKLFSLEIEPEKEIILMVISSEISRNVVTAIQEKMELSMPGRGILFTQNIEEVYGIK